MRSGWPTKTLGELCEFVRGPFGGSLKKSVFVEDGFAVYEQQHAIYNQFEKIRYFIDAAKFREMQRFELRPKDLIMSCSGTMGKVAVVPNGIRRGIINQALLKLTPSSALSAEFLKYWMDSKDFQASLREQSGGAAIQNVASVSILKQIQISLPPLPEQRRIVGILDEAFESIAIAKANAEMNLRNARAIFASHLQSVFTQRGDGWVEKPLGSLASFRNGINYTKDSKGERIKIVGVRNFQRSFSAPLHDLDTVTIDGELSALDSLRQDDILTVRSNGNIELIGRCILIGEVTEKISHSGFTVRIRLSHGEVLPRYLCHIMKSASSRKRLTDGGTGTNIKSLNQGMLSALAIPFPPISIQKVLVEKLESLSEETKRLESTYQQKLVALDALKKSLLHQAFTGAL